MSNLERTSWKDGFPFFHNPFWQALAKGTGGSDLSRMRVLDAHIPEGHALKAAYPSVPPAPPGAMPRRSPVDALPPGARLQAQRPVGRQSGLRLLPLESFIWGSRGQPPRPRTRPDHILIWVTAGQMHLDFPRDHHLMGADTIRVVPAGTAFAAVPQPGLAGHALLIAPDLLRDVDPPLPFTPLSVPTDEAGHALHLTLAELGEEAIRPAARQSLTCLLTLLSLRLSELQPAMPEESEPT